jgi:hypothetical protein
MQSQLTNFWQKYERHLSKMPLILWFGLSLIAAIQLMLYSPQKINNYLVFKGVFTHTLAQINLYNEYPLEYFDKNHYGPVFSTLIAPFTFLPNMFGCVLWI